MTLETENAGGQDAGQESQEQDAQQTQQQEQQAIDEANTNLSAGEILARQNGWVSRQEWIDSGNKPEDWISASRYNATGDLLRKVKTLEKQQAQFNQRIADNNAFWLSRLQVERESLVAQRDTAIDKGDKNAVKEFDKQIQNVDQTAAQINLQNNGGVATPQGQQPAINPTDDPADIQIENAYILSLPKGQQAYAQQVGGLYAKEGLTGQSLVDAVRAEMAKEFPAQNQNRQKHGKMNGSGRGNQGGGDNVTLDTLTPQDKMAMNAMRRTSARYANKSDSELLKIISDSKIGGSKR